MIGSNTITLNEATLVEAVQFYFDNEVFNRQSSPTVRSIKTVNVGFDDLFKVEVENAAQPQETPK